MNKGFGSNTYPKSFSIVTKAQIVLSTQIIGSVSKEFEKIKKEFANKKKSEEIIIAELAELKTRVRKPEDIHEDEIDEILSTISVVDTERYLREREMERIAAEQQKEENQRLLSEIEKTKLKLTENESTANKIIQQKEEESNHYKACLAESNNKVIEQLNNQIIEIETRKNKADTKIKKRIRGVCWIPAVAILGYIFIISFFAYKYSWEKMGYVTWLIPMLVILISYILFSIGIKSFNPQDIINIKYKEYYTKKMYTQYGIDLDKLELLKKQKKELEQNNIDL
jgi:Fe2+ transport system protein B